jgi:phosphoribosyl 1,2-cyclic phosphodiesterase
MDLLRERVDQVEILFTHFHMDHLFGFPFFGPIYSPNCKVRVNLPAYSETDAESKISRYLNGIYHPVRVKDIPSQLEFEGLRPGRVIERGPYRITSVPLNHPGGATGYRVEADGQSVVFLTDTAPLTTPDDGITADKTPPSAERKVMDVMKEADLVIMDTMFSYEEYLERMTWGHAYPEYGAKLCKLTGAKKLALFHHSPDASDDELDALAAEWVDHLDPIVFLSKEGEVIDLSG